MGWELGFLALGSLVMLGNSQWVGNWKMVVVSTLGICEKDGLEIGNGRCDKTVEV